MDVRKGGEERKRGLRISESWGALQGLNGVECGVSGVMGEYFYGWIPLIDVPNKTGIDE